MLLILLPVLVLFRPIGFSLRGRVYRLGGERVSSLTKGGNNHAHNVGEVWCSALWEAFVGLVAKYGHADAEARVLKYVVGGLKLTPLAPTMVQARDAILRAIGTLDPADLPVARGGFAKSGMGVGAVGPASSSSSLTDVEENFTP